MKRLTEQLICHFARQQLRRERAFQKARIKREKKRREQKCKHIANEKAITITAPEKFDIHNPKQRHILLKFIKSVQEQFNKPGTRIIILDFGPTKQVIVTGMLLFYARLSHLMSIKSNQIVLRCKPPRSNLVDQVLKQVGVYEYCKHPFRGTVKHDDVIHWQVARGMQIDANRYAHILGKYEGSLAEPLVDGVFRGLAEAMANSIEHAYMDNSEGKSPPENLGWWVFSQVKDGVLSVAMCDLGIGIPKTLPLRLPGFFGRLKDSLGFPTDVQCIVAAIEESKTRTQKQERGKGLGNIIAAAGERGTVIIYSNRGCYVSDDGKAEAYNYSREDNLEGTLVFWKLPLNKEVMQ